MNHFPLKNLFVAITALTSVGLFQPLEAVAGNFRTITGTTNNLTNPTYGEAGSELLRLFDEAYDDGFNSPRGGAFNASSLPNPRTISNTAVQQSTRFVPNTKGLSNWVWQWGQIIDHDLSLSEGNLNTSLPEDFLQIDVPVSAGDPLSGEFIPFIRVPATSGTGTGIGNPRQQDNELTAFIDASSVYGSSNARATALRTNDGTGRLLTSTADNGEILLPRIAGLNNANGGTGLTGTQLFSAGDIRANEQLGLNAIHTVLVREHNRVADDLSNRLTGGDTALQQKLTDSGLSQEDFVYESARKVVGAKVQAITYNEFVPILLGESASGVFGLEAYSGYDDTVNPGVASEFSNAVYRLGHTLLPPELQIGSLDANNTISLADAFFNPEFVQKNGVDAILEGLAFSQQSEFDNFLVEEVRSILFNAPTGGTDLAAINIARGRDVGLPSYTSVAETLLGITLDNFQDIVDSGLISADVVSLLQAAYTNVDEIDLWLGVISEQAVNGGLLGAVGNIIVADQFRRTRDGDRFFYLNDLAHLELLAPDIQQTTLASLLTANTSVNFTQDPFEAQSVPESSSVIALFALGALGIGSRLRSRFTRFHNQE